MQSWDNKSPIAFDYVGFSWAKDLVEGESISLSSWSIIQGDSVLVLSVPGIDATTKSTTTFVASGTPDSQYKLRNTITTSATPARTLVKESLLNIR